MKMHSKDLRLLQEIILECSNEVIEYCKSKASQFDRQQELNIRLVAVL